VSFDPRLPRDDVNVSKTHPLAEAWWLVVGAAIAGLVLTVVALAFSDVAVRWLPASVEARLFGGLAEAGTEGSGDPPRAAAARAVLARLAAHWPENPYELHLSVLDEDTPNAFALPGGSVVVTRGLLDQAESENELAFVLGHEIGHFAGRHHLQAIGRALVLSLTLSAVFGSVGADAVPRLASDLASRGYARRQERAADRFGLGLVESEYGHVAGADRFFARLPDAKARFGDRAVAWFVTHPVTEQRIAAIRTFAAERGWPPDGPLTPLPAR
jgi:Zn-dependent protease with chaperone function